MSDWFKPDFVNVFYCCYFITQTIFFPLRDLKPSNTCVFVLVIALLTLHTANTVMTDSTVQKLNMFCLYMWPPEHPGLYFHYWPKEDTPPEMGCLYLLKRYLFTRPPKKWFFLICFNVCCFFAAIMGYAIILWYQSLISKVLVVWGQLVFNKWNVYMFWAYPGIMELLLRATQKDLSERSIKVVF